MHTHEHIVASTSVCFVSAIEYLQVLTEKCSRRHKCWRQNPKVNMRFLMSTLLFLSAASPSALGYTAWQGETTGFWNTRSNWAGGFPTTASTVRLNHEYQTNAYTVTVQSNAVAETLSIEAYSNVPVRVHIANTGSLRLYSMRMGSKEEDRESSVTIDGGSVWGLDASDSAVTNTALLIGDNPGCEATLSVLNGGWLFVLGANGLIIGNGKESLGRLVVSNGNMRIKESLLLGKGPNAVGELLVSGTSSISITGALHVAKLDFGDFSPTGIVQVAGGVLECGTLNIGANGTGSLTLSGGTVRALAGGITLGQTTSTAQVNVSGGTLETIGSSMSIGHLDSTGTLLMTDGIVHIDGIISLGSSSRSTGRLDVSGGALSAKQLIICAATSSTASVHIREGSLYAGESVHVGPAGTGSLFLDGGTLTTTNFLLGGSGTAECRLAGGELVIQGTSNDSVQISNSVLQLEKALIQWSHPNVTDWITNAVSTGAIAWSNGLAHGTYSSNGFDGAITNGDSVLYWDNLDNGSPFSRSAIWVEQRPTPYEMWASGYGLFGRDAEVSANPDSDAMPNLIEYGLGGNPTNDLDPGVLPCFGRMDTDGTNAFEYVYRRRRDAAARGLTYFLELNPDLVAGTWTNDGYSVVGTGAINTDFEAVTNRVPAEALLHQFIRLKIRLD